MPVEISIELEGSFNHDIDLGISRKKKDFLWYYKPDKDGRRFDQRKKFMNGNKVPQKQERL
jgi:hypothetical protein